MRSVYEFWSPYLNRQMPSAEIDIGSFMAIGFSNHVDFMTKAKTVEECMRHLDAVGTFDQRRIAGAPQSGRLPSHWGFAQ